MIHIDILNTNDNHIQITGDNKTIAYELAKVTASYLVTFYPDADRDDELYHLSRMTLRMLGDVERQIKKNGQLVKMPVGLVKRATQPTAEERLLKAIFGDDEEDKNDEKK